MTQGIIISNSESNVGTSDPRNLTVDTRQSGGLKVHSIQFFNESEYTELYEADGPYPGSRFTYGRIRIKHKLGFPPAIKGYIVSLNDDGKAIYSQVLPASTGVANTSIYCNSEEVVVDQCPPLDDPTGPYSITVIIFAENLEATNT